MKRGVMRSRAAYGLPLVFLFLGAPGLGAQGVSQTQTSDSVPSFRHETHRAVDCQECHETAEGEETHPQLGLPDCRACHHREPVSSNCERCHAASDARVVTRLMVRTLDIRIGSLDRPERALPLRHSDHEGVGCQTCHSDGLARSAADVACAACHEDHHRPTARCWDCHASPSDGSHDRQVHLGCGGSGCHMEAPAHIQMVPRTRAFCLTCHDGMTYHKPGDACASCHRLPPPRGADR